MSDEDWESNQSGSEEEEVIKGGRRKKDHDSDFVVEEEDDSDWEEQKSRGKVEIYSDFHAFFKFSWELSTVCY